MSFTIDGIPCFPSKIKPEVNLAKSAGHGTGNPYYFDKGICELYGDAMKIRNFGVFSNVEVILDAAETGTLNEVKKFKISKAVQYKGY